MNSDYPKLTIFCLILSVLLFISTVDQTLSRYHDEMWRMAFIILYLPQVLTIRKTVRRKEKLSKSQIVILICFFLFIIVFVAVLVFDLLKA
ncbi:MAG TPA: hypothetical protein VHP31_11525 [Caproicibacter sp.]|nr:hypothetical protein [Caproicibacter sp.]